MRFIDISRLHFPNGWQAKATEAKRKFDNDEKTINQQSSVWADLKDALANLSDDKCWYCECMQVRSDNAVDHFRPKNNVSNTSPQHDGYTWLAFEYKNYRYSCTFCNSKRKNPDTRETEGKGDEFPLWDESKRVYHEIGNLRDEEPMLLDPCKSNDVGLLDFRDNGVPCPRYVDNDKKKKRAEESIRLYHLDHPALNEKRRELALEIKKKIDEVEEFLESYPTLEPSESLRNDLQGFINERSELSVFARRIIMGRRDIEWIEDLICTA